jgi:hypothetical protein
LSLAVVRNATVDPIETTEFSQCLPAPDSRDFANGEIRDEFRSGSLRSAPARWCPAFRHWRDFAASRRGEDQQIQGLVEGSEIASISGIQAPPKADGPSHHKKDTDHADIPESWSRRASNT